MRIIDADNLHWAKFQDTSGYGVSVAHRLGWNDAIDTICENEPTITTKQVKYYDEDENVWKIGEVIVDE